LYSQQLENDDLSSEYDVLLFPDGAVPMDDQAPTGRQGRRNAQPTDVPAEFAHMTGRTTVGTTVPKVLDYTRRGGTVVAIGSSTNLAYHAELPVSNHLQEAGQPLPEEQYYVPGSVLDLKLEHTSPLTHGLGDRASVLFSNSPVFSVESGAAGIRTIGHFDRPDPLRSGWAWGQHYLEGGATLLEADVGQGKMFLFGPKVTFRGQSHGTFPLVFNAIFYGAAEAARPQAEDDDPFLQR